MPPKHSRLGIASFILSIVANLLLVILFAAVAVIAVSVQGELDPESPTAFLIGLSVFAYLFVALVALGLGIAGLLQSNRKKLFAVLGMVFSLCGVFGTFFLILLGLAAE